jgi:hypothetical protein
MDWLRIIWLAISAVVMLVAYRQYQVGAGTTVIMALAWIAIFMLAASIAGWIADLDRGEPDAPPSTTSQLNLT